jgi:hypothetical protein
MHTKVEDKPQRAGIRGNCVEEDRLYFSSEQINHDKWLLPKLPPFGSVEMILPKKIADYSYVGWPCRIQYDLRNQ